ncbi:MAG: sugar transferase [Anaerolineaceae bacterium]|nr:sugar transferase [Anaerolineaceae bacterium]
MNKNKKNTPIVKRMFDILFSLLAIALLSPLLLVIGIFNALMVGFPILFKQTRPGKNGVPFTLCKFRTMKEDKDRNGSLLPDKERITSFGKFLRKTSLDELPELFNVIKGDMSIVGPRPLLMQYLERYSPKQARRHEMLPGITGWAQVNGRNAISWEEKFRLDVWYIDHWSFWLDMKIILLTIWKVVTGKGVSQPGKATMDEFKGNSTE